MLIGLRGRRMPAILVPVVVLITGCTLVPHEEEVTAPPTGKPAELLAQLGAPRTEDTGAHYRRDDWGEWAYDRSSKCNTRERVLARDGTDEVVDEQCRPTCPRRSPKPACWASRYDGVAVYDPAELQIDHIVPVREATRSGARSWTARQRADFYNDPANLLAVTGRTNASKGDSDPGRWRPPDRTVWCDYASAYTAIKVKYGLHADQKEHAALTQMLGTCPADRG